MRPCWLQVPPEDRPGPEMQPLQSVRGWEPRRSTFFSDVPWTKPICRLSGDQKYAYPPAVPGSSRHSLPSIRRYDGCRRLALPVDQRQSRPRRAATGRRVTRRSPLDYPQAAGASACAAAHRWAVVFRALSRGNATARRQRARRRPSRATAAASAARAVPTWCVAQQVSDRNTGIADVVQPLLGIPHEGVGEQPAEAGRACPAAARSSPDRASGPAPACPRSSRPRTRGGRSASRRARSRTPRCRSRLSTGWPARLLGAHVGRRAQDRCPRACRRP